MQPEMKYIYTVYQCGSFSKAARKAFPDPACFKYFRTKVEHEVGMPLYLTRDKKPLS